MKTVLSLTVLVAAASCGKKVQDNALLSEKTIRSAVPISGTLGEVIVRSAPGPRRGDFTLIQVKYSVDCSEKLENFSYQVRKGDNDKTDLLVSAVTTRSVVEDGVKCQSIRNEIKTITVPSIMLKSSINLVNLLGTPEQLLLTTKLLKSVSVSVVSVKALCPPGAPCLPGNDNTIVKLRSEPMICVDKLAPVTFAFEKKNAKGKVKLAVSALQAVDSRLVQCVESAREVEITLNQLTATAEDVELILVGTN